MKAKFTALVAVFAMAAAFSTAAFSQTEITDDVVFLKVGYTNSTTSFEEESADDLELSGVALQGEYNINLKPLLIGIGVEYQYVTGDDETKVQFLNPMVTAKFMTAGGLYIGAGVTGRYMLGYDDKFDSEVDKKMDLWGHAVIGFIFPIDEGIYFDVEGKIGYNLTGNQYEKSFSVKTDSAFDLSIYAGIGFRAFSTGL